MTGAPAWSWVHSELLYYEDAISKEDLYETMLYGMENDYMFGAGTSSTNPCDLCPNHAYSAIDMCVGITGSDGNEYDLIVLRNPWGIEKDDT